MKKFTFAMKWHEILKPYSDEIRREVYDAIIEYVATGTIIDMQPLSRMAFDFIRYEIDEKERRKEERLAKKQQSPESPESPKPEINKIADSYLASDKAPKPITVKNGGIRVTMSRSRISALTRMCAQNLLDKGHNPTDPGFISVLDTLVTNRFEIIRQDLMSRRPTAPFSEELWDAIILDACSRFRA